MVSHQFRNLATKRLNDWKVKISLIRGSRNHLITKFVTKKVMIIQLGISNLSEKPLSTTQNVKVHKLFKRKHHLHIPHIITNKTTLKLIVSTSSKTL